MTDEEMYKEAVPTEPSSVRLPSSALVGDRDRADNECSAIEHDLQELVVQHTAELELVHATHRVDAVNLIHYLALRRRDLHDFQRRLTELGLSSLGRCEPHVMASIVAIHAMLSGRTQRVSDGVVSFQQGREALDTNTNTLFGKRPRNRVPRIMVTLDEQAAED